MLITRVITALCLLLLILPILFLAPIKWLAGLVAVIVLLAGWGFGPPDRPARALALRLRGGRACWWC